MLNSEIITRFRTLSGDERVGGHAADVLWSDDDIILMINDAVTRLCMTSKCLKGQQQVSLVAGTIGYAYATNTLKITSASFNLTGVPLHKTTESTLNNTVSSWKDVSGTPQYFFIDTGLKTINFYPVPDAASDIDITAYIDAADLTLTTESPAIPEEYHTDIVTFLLKQAFSTHDSGVYDSEKAKEQDALWEIAIQRAKSHEKRNRDM